MRLRSFLLPVWSLISALVMATSPGWAASAVVKDGNTLQLGDTTYRLDGIDAPELDQLCIDDHADPWTCGVDARDQLVKLIGQRPVRCSDQGPDRNHRRRHRGICTVEGETTSLNESLVRQGFAMNFEPAAKGRFRDEEAGAKNDRRGLWKGCFVSPEEFRHGKRDGILLGRSCRADKDREIREALFPTRLRNATRLQHQGQIRGAGAGHRRYRRLSFAGVPQLSGADQAGSLVLLRGRGAGGRLSQGL